MKRSLLLLPFAVLAVAPSALAEGYTETKLYTQATGDTLVLQCDASDPDLGGIGGVCFDLAGGELGVALTIDDVTGLPVGAAYEFVDAVGLDQGTVLASGAFCGEAANVPVPEGAVSLIVYVDGPVFGPLDCAPESPGIGVRGTITATFA